MKALGNADLAGSDHLSGQLPFKSGGIPFVAARSVDGGYFDALLVDSDDSGQIDEKVIAVAPRIAEDGSAKTWFEVPIRLNHAAQGEKRDVGSVSLQLYLVVDARAEIPSFVRMRRLDFRIGAADLGDARKTTVILRELTMNGIYDEKDGWELVEDGAKSTAPRKMSDFAWAGGKAWRIIVNNRQGKSVRIVPHDPGLTEEQDLIRRDTYRRDRLAPRADKPVVFRRDVAKAIADAQVAMKPYFLKFETEWCGPCKLMADLVFPSKDVSEAAKGVMCIVVDGDDHKDLVSEHKITAYPTGTLFDGNGNPQKRYVGYQGVDKLTAFFRKLP